MTYMQAVATRERLHPCLLRDGKVAGVRESRAFAAAPIDQFLAASCRSFMETVRGYFCSATRRHSTASSSFSFSST